MAKKHNRMDKIDFVLVWVDDSDPQWQESYRKYYVQTTGDAASIRFRDWGTLKYWFRGIEKFAPWVNNIFFVTCGHVPSWLNLEHPRLRFVKHADYIPAECLPTFNSHTIELNLHRIDELSDKFVYFNDDTFLIDRISSERFFRKGLPCDIAALNAPQFLGDRTEHILVNDIAFANKFFNKREAIGKHPGKWFSPKYGSYLLRTLALFRYPRFTGFVDPHLPNAFLKKTLSEVWNLYGEKLDHTCKCRFRDTDQVNQYVFRYYQLVKGSFCPIDPFRTSITYSSIDDETLQRAIADVRAQRKPLICINDGKVTDFKTSKRLLCDAFESILPEKSEFEK